MITTHLWTGTWDNKSWDARPSYGPCETIVKGVPCGKPRHEHKHPEPARPKKTEQEKAEEAYPHHHPDTALSNYRAGREVWDTNGDQW